MKNDLFEKLSQSKKYRDVCPDTIRRIIDECHGRYKKAKDMEKAVREKLHGITSAFLSDTDSAKTIDEAAQMFGDDGRLESLLQRHVSTRERLPLSAMDDLYARIFEVTGQPKSVLDLACGLNPLYLVQRTDTQCQIVGVDISASCVRVLNSLEREGVRGHCADLLCENAIPTERFHIALLFKILPLLERQRSGAAMETMSIINAEYLVVSFPTRTMGGRNVGMEGNYSEWMETHVPANRAIVHRFTADNELFYILKEN